LTVGRGMGRVGGMAVRDSPGWAFSRGLASRRGLTVFTGSGLFTSVLAAPFEAAVCGLTAGVAAAAVEVGEATEGAGAAAECGAAEVPLEAGTACGASILILAP